LKLPGLERTVCARENTGQKVKEERNLEDDTFQVVSILVQKTIMVRKLPRYFGLRTERTKWEWRLQCRVQRCKQLFKKYRNKYVTHIATSTDNSQDVNSLLTQICDRKFVNPKLKKIISLISEKMAHSNVISQKNLLDEYK
jgi:hypothetical protein